MSNEKKTYNQFPENHSENGLTDIHSQSPSTSDIEKLKKLYLPKSKDDYHPSENSIESANNLQHPKPPSPSSLT